ncbi:MAG: ROK family protein [Rikenellaceae bacterium]
MKKLIFGVDIGGINSAFGLVDTNGDIFAEGVVSTRAYPSFEDYSSYVKDLAIAMKGAAQTLDFEAEIVGIGIGAPNANFYMGTIEQPANLWKYSSAGGDESKRIFHLCRDLGAYFPEIENIHMTNDANAATIGEMIFGNARGLKDFAMVTLGTGLGSGFVAGGELIYGHDGFAGEMGHMTVIPGGRECGCGKKGCLECYVSATGIKRTAFEMMATYRGDSPLRQIPFSEFDSAMISRAANDGDPLALEIFRYTGEILGAAIANIATITSPEAVIIFGGLAKAGELIFAPTRKYMEENLFPAYKGKIRLLPSGIQDRNIAIIGAASLIMKDSNSRL